MALSVMNLLIVLTTLYALPIFGLPPKQRMEQNSIVAKNNQMPDQIAPPADDAKTGKGEAADEKMQQQAQIQLPAQAVKKMPAIVKQPDHLEAVPLERDGHLNKKFRQEVFMGRDSNDAMLNRIDDAYNNNGDDGHDLPRQRAEKRMNEQDPAGRLQAVFHKADTNKDGKLSSAEMVSWIMQTTLRHLDEAVLETKKVFKLIDHDGDDLLSWDEYHLHFLVDNKLMDPQSAKQHKEEDHADLDLNDQEKIEQDLEEWGEADADGVEGLSMQEFLSFRHPEHSQRMLELMVRDIIKSLDRNGDGRLSEDEFAAAPPGDVEPQWREQEQTYLDERRKEFRDAIDGDKDGFATMKELLEYSNPRNPQHARQETRDLMEIADSDRDGLLSLQEVLDNKQLFLGSGMVNPARNMHDEF